MPVKRGEQPARRRKDDFLDEEEETKPKRRASRDDDDEEDSRPIRRRRDDSEEDEKPKSRRRTDDDDDDDAPRSKKESGWAALASKKKEYEENRGDDKPKEFWLGDDESAVVQFLDEEPLVVEGHSVKFGKDKNFKFTPCQLMTQRHCMMCRDGVKQVDKFVFKIIDYRGDWDKDKKRFKYNKKYEKLWYCGMKMAEQLKTIADKKGKKLTELVLEVSRSGSGKSTTYNFEQAFDESDNKMKPVSFKEEFGATKALVKPLSDERLEKLGFSDED